MDIDSMSLYLNYLLSWVGLGTAFGLAALIVMPSSDGSGNLATLLMAVAGTVCGCFLMQGMSYDGLYEMPISATGFFVGLGGAAVMLIFFRVIGGQEMISQQGTLFRHNRRRRRRHLKMEEIDERAENFNAERV